MTTNHPAAPPHPDSPTIAPEPDRNGGIAAEAEPLTKARAPYAHLGGTAVPNAPVRVIVNCYDEKTAYREGATRW